MLTTPFQFAALALTLAGCAAAADAPEETPAADVPTKSEESAPLPPHETAVSDLPRFDVVPPESPLAACSGVYVHDRITKVLHRTASGCQIDSQWRLHEDGTADYLAPSGVVPGFFWQGDKSDFRITRISAHEVLRFTLSPALMKVEAPISVE